MTTPPLTHTVEGLMALVKSFGHIEILGAMGKVTALQRKKAWEDVQSYAVWLVDATAVDAAAEALKGKPVAQPSDERILQFLAPWLVTPADEHDRRDMITAVRALLAEPMPEDGGLAAYPTGDVVGPCVCGSWPGGRCFRCRVVRARTFDEAWKAALAIPDYLYRGGESAKDWFRKGWDQARATTPGAKP